MSIETILLIGSLLILCSIAIMVFFENLGIPALVLFLTVGMVAGSDGIGGIYFDNPGLARSIGIVALVVFPSRLPAIAWHGMLISTFLMLSARPVAVFVSLASSKLRIREKGFLSWVGLRGAVPIILATFPFGAGVPEAGAIFDIVFFIVLISRSDDFVIPDGSTRLREGDVITLITKTRNPERVRGIFTALQPNPPPPDRS